MPLAITFPAHARHTRRLAPIPHELIPRTLLPTLPADEEFGKAVLPAISRFFRQIDSRHERLTPGGVFPSAGVDALLPLENGIAAPFLSTLLGPHVAAFYLRAA